MHHRGWMRRPWLARPALGALLLAACSDGATPPTSARAAADLVDAEATLSVRASDNAVRPLSSGATVYVVHGINGTDLALPEALPVDIEVNGSCAITALPFRAIRGPLTLPAGAYDINVRLAASPACSGAAVIAVPGATLADGDNVSIVAHLSATGAPTASIFANDRSGNRPAALAARHVAAFGPVDVAVGNTRVFTGVANGQGGTAAITPGHVRVSIFPAGQSPAAFSARIAPRAGFLTILYAVGTPAKGTFEVLAQEIRLQRNTRIAVIHGINGTDLGRAESLPVDVELNGSCVLRRFTFRTVTAPLTVPVGRYDIRVRIADRQSCTGPVVISVNGVGFDSDETSTVVAHLSASGQPTASVFRDRLAGPTSQATVAARHTAAFGPVDILVNGSAAFTNLVNGQGRSAALAPGAPTIAIAPAGSTTPVFSAAPTLPAGTLTALYAVGTPARGTFEVLAQQVTFP